MGLLGGSYIMPVILGFLHRVHLKELTPRGLELGGNIQFINILSSVKDCTATGNKLELLVVL